MLAMTNRANVRLANPLSVPNAMPIERCFLGVTSICSATRIAEKSATPHHKSHSCGRYIEKPINAAMLTQCNAMLM